MSRQYFGGASGDGLLGVCAVGAMMHPLTRAYVAAAAQAGISTLTDYNGAAMEGAELYLISTAHGRRASTAQA